MGKHAPTRTQIRSELRLQVRLSPRSLAIKASGLMTSHTPTIAPGRFPAGRLAFPHDHLTGIGHLERHEILYLLAAAEEWVELNREGEKHRDLLAGRTIINAFFENSTRTLLSFEIAGKRLGADVVNMQASTSSLKKG
jgi:aspartate carbamoyltransferase catalytic subunit